MENAIVKPRRWPRFSLRTLFILVTLSAIPLGWVAWQARIVQRRLSMRRWITENSGFQAVDVGPYGIIECPYHVRRAMGDIWIIDSIAFDSPVSESRLAEIRQLFPEAKDVYIWERPTDTSASNHSGEP